MTTEPLTFMFADDGNVPNNPLLPLVIYRGAVDVAAARDPESAIEQLFMATAGATACGATASFRTRISTR